MIDRGSAAIDKESDTLYILTDSRIYAVDLLSDTLILNKAIKVYRPSNIAKIKIEDLFITKKDYKIILHFRVLNYTPTMIVAGALELDSEAGNVRYLPVHHSLFYSISDKQYKCVYHERLRRMYYLFSDHVLYIDIDSDPSVKMIKSLDLNYQFSMEFWLNWVNITIALQRYIMIIDRHTGEIYCIDVETGNVEKK